MSDAAPSATGRTLGDGNRFRLGLFGANCSSGRAVTLVPERWSGEWDDCVALARMADAAGLDFMLPIGRWKGYGGASDYQGATFETVTWASGLLAQTERITVFGTVHAPLVNPINAAKQFVTADHIGHGRFGLNVVCGWNEDEFEMFGVAQRGHQQRYEYAQEWLDAIFRMWGPEEFFDFNGQFMTLKDVRAKPKPFGGSRPIVMNAGASGVGRDFAVRNCDAFFTNIDRDDLEKSHLAIAEAKAAARAYHRDIDIYSVAAVCCRPTRAEAEEYYRYSMVDHADWAAVDAILAQRGITPESQSPESFERARMNTASGLGQVLLVGSPDDVAGWLVGLAEAGLTGLAISFVNYLDELPYFRDEVLPRVARAGWRL
jgi:alkanesulfonate monooxygenase SsuD/methylene tetrahydromethanopterin reductase-like flavin-dependent oxidoreductase (luciferase family)